VYKVEHHPRGWRPAAHHFLIVLLIIRSKKSQGVGNFHFVPLDPKVGGPALTFQCLKAHRETAELMGQVQFDSPTHWSGVPVSGR
jgi:hypothetical protein